MLLAYPMVLCVQMPRVRPPAIRIKTGDAQRGQERFELEENVLLPPPKDVRQHRACVVINRLPQPARIGCAADGTPPLIEL